MRQFGGGGMTTLEQALESSVLFGGFAQAAQLADVREYCAGDTVLDHTSAQSVLGVVISGRLSISRVDGSHIVPLNSLEPGGCFGASTLFCRGGALLTHISACCDSSVAIFSEQTVRRLVESNSAFAVRYIEFLTDRIRFLNSKITDFTAGSASERVAGELVRSAQADRCVVPSYSAMAKKLDIARATLYRAFDELEAAGEIARDGKTVIILDSDALRRRVSI